MAASGSGHKTTSSSVDIVNSRINEYFEKMAHDVEMIASSYESTPAIESILKYIRDYPLLHLEKEEIQRKKRQNTIVPSHLRCVAKCGKGERCSRRKQEDSMFCGTHLKGSPWGIVAPDNEPSLVSRKLPIWLEDFNGIQYYIDEEGRVYDHHDIIEGIANPRVVAKWVEDDEGKLRISME